MAAVESEINSSIHILFYSIFDPEMRNLHVMRFCLLFYYFPFRSAKSVLRNLALCSTLSSSPFPPRHADPFRARLSLSARCVSLLACCTRSRAISPGLTRGGSRELQLQLHARWGYAGLGRVRCTSRPSVCPRPASSLPSVTSLLPLRLLCPPSSSTLLSSSFSSSSFLLILALVVDDYFPFPSRRPRETRTCTPLLASHMEYAFVCVPRGIYICACVRVSVSPRVSCPPSRKRRYDTIFGQCDSPHDVRFSKRRWIPCRECRISVIVTVPWHHSLRIAKHELHVAAASLQFLTVMKHRLSYIDICGRNEGQTHKIQIFMSQI